MVFRIHGVSLCVGLTGGIASGKSTVAEKFSELGVPVIDADQVARDVVVPGSAGLAAVIAHFGTDFLQADGNLNRRRLREAIFTEPAQRQQLESLLHPLIHQGLAQWRAVLNAGYGLLMAPIMTEGGFDQHTDRILVVDVSRDTQKQRLMARDDIDEILAEQMLNAQADRASRLAIADDVIDNSAPASNLQSQVEQLHRRYQQLAGV